MVELSTEQPGAGTASSCLAEPSALARAHPTRPQFGSHAPEGDRGLGYPGSESSTPPASTRPHPFPTLSWAPPESGGIQATVRQLVVLEVEFSEVGLAAQGSSGHLGDEVVLGREERMKWGGWSGSKGSGELWKALE